MSVRIITSPRGGGWLLLDPRHPEPDPETGFRQTLFCIKGPVGNPWVWNGNTESPTIHPSYLHTRPGDPSFRDHWIIADGRVHFCSDSLHAWAGQTMDLPEFTDAEAAYYSAPGGQQA